MPTATAQRLLSEQRGKIVRALAEHAGTARIDDCLRAMIDADEFNARHPERAIPAPFRLLGIFPLICVCGGEGVVLVRVPARLSATFGTSSTTTCEETVCPRCEGSGWTGVYGVGAAARVVPSTPLTAPRT
jgi:hypothetical protein